NQQSNPFRASLGRPASATALGNQPAALELVWTTGAGLSGLEHAGSAAPVLFLVLAFHSSLFPPTSFRIGRQHMRSAETARDHAVLRIHSIAYAIDDAVSHRARRSSGTQALKRL